MPTEKPGKTGLENSTDAYKKRGNPSFKIFKQFNRSHFGQNAQGRWRLDERAAHFFKGEDICNRIARQICIANVLNLKELLESFEFFFKVERQIQRPCVVDMCAGHGLTGLLFAALIPSVTKVILVDHKKPAFFDRLLKTIGELTPWVMEKCTFFEAKIDRVSSLLPGSFSMVGVHGCGIRSDRVLDLAIEKRTPVAIMPCCYHKGPIPTSPAFKKTLGLDLAVDIQRTHRLEQAGFKVDWRFIPREITPHNRIVFASPTD